MSKKKMPGPKVVPEPKFTILDTFKAARENEKARIEWYAKRDKVNKLSMLLLQENLK